jgi:serine-type D-Ala-D-Ala carboxypeptidase
MTSAGKRAATSITVPPPRLTAEYQSAAGRAAGCLPADGFPAVSALLLRQLAAGMPPAVALEVRGPASAAYAAAGGWAKLPGPSRDGPAADPVAAGAQTVFDLASLTKVVGTLPLVLALHQRGRWSIDDPVARWLPGAPSSPVTISDLLLHAAGLVPHREYYATHTDPAAIRRAVISELSEAIPGPVAYSDLGFMLLGWAAEECAGEPLDTLVQREVVGPLGMTATSFRPAAARSEIAATEAAPADQQPAGDLTWGTVHDENARALGGVSGHAGLFGTAADLGRYAAALLRPARHPVLSPRTIALMTARQVRGGAEARVLGWRIRPGPAWGDWPAGTLWHTGFTGTSLLIAPELGTAVALLTNAVHPVRRLPEMAEMRADLHRAIRAALFQR